MAEASDTPIEYIAADLPEALIDIDSNIYPHSSLSDYQNAEPMDTHVQPTGNQDDERDFSKMSDHITVWVDTHIGKEGEYADFKEKFDKLQVLKSSLNEQNTVDDESMIYADQKMLANLRNDCYCLKYFSEIPKAVEYIRQHPEKRIFFVSSGSIGKEIVPQIYDLPQIQGIYIFCGNISAHVEWASEYIDNITAMLEHQDNLLTRLSRDIADYLQAKGDEYKQKNSYIAARNCYSWALKLLLRSKELGDNGAIKYIQIVKEKVDNVLKSIETNR